MKKIILTMILFFVFTGVSYPAQFVLVHGSWHGAWCWYKIETLLKQEGHTVTVVDLPSHGIDTTAPETVTLQDYTDTVVAAIDHIGEEEQVILVGHSMGGIVASSVANEVPLKIDKLVYLAAFMLDQGQAMMDISMLDEDSLINSNTLIPNADWTVLDIDRTWVQKIFYEQSNIFDITLAERLIVPEPGLPVLAQLALDDPRYWNIPRFYIKTMNDNAISPAIQQMMIDRLGVEQVFPIYTDHSPFFSRPYHLLAVLQRIAHDTGGNGEWTGKD